MEGEAIAAGQSDQAEGDRGAGNGCAHHDALQRCEATFGTAPLAIRGSRGQKLERLRILSVT
jgi:hypothetical protein